MTRVYVCVCVCDPCMVVCVWLCVCVCVQYSLLYFMTEYGGMGLDYTYSVAVAEELGSINCGGIPMAIGVQTDMATPALARYRHLNSL